MEITTVPTGPLQSNAYIVREEGRPEAVIIDPGDDAAILSGNIDDNGLELKYILLTHGHYDHIGAVALLKQKYGAKVAVHREDAFMLEHPTQNPYSSPDMAPCRPDVLLVDGDDIDVGAFKVSVMHTPGHTGGGVCYRIGNSLFTGDTLFAQTIGRTDLPGGDGAQMRESLKKLESLNIDYRIYPGHGPSTTLKYEKQHNPFLRAK